MLNNVFSHYVNKNFLFFPMHSFLLKQHYVRLLFCIIILSEKKSSQSTFMIKLLISRTIVPFRQIVISYFILYQLTANADYAIKASKGWDILCPQKVFFGIDKVFEIDRIKRINEKQTFLCKQSCHFLR